MDEEKSGVTFGDICRTVWSQKWLALILFIVIAVAGTLALKYGYGSVNAEYTSDFSINIKTNGDGMFEYPDGTSRSYRDLVSIDNLNAVKAQDGRFASLNVEKMRRSGDISISRNKEENEDVTYTLRVKAKYFSSADEASRFIGEIVGTPSREIYNWVNGLAADMGVSFGEKLGNEQKLEYIKSQLNGIDRRFESLSGISDAAKQKVSNLLLTATALTGELHTHYYEPDAEALENYSNLIKGLESERDLAKAVLDNLKGLGSAGGSSGDAVIVVSADIVKYAEKVETLNRRIEVYENYIDKNPVGAAESDESKAFTVKLGKLLADVQSLTATEECGYYLNTSLVSYEGAPIREAGGFGVMKSAVISIVAGFVVAVLIAYAVGYAKAKKAGLKAASDGNSDGEDIKT